MSLRRTLGRPIPLLAIVLAASGVETMQPTPARAPTADTPGSHLIDRVIPAYGMTSVHDARSRAGDLFARVHAFLGEIDAKVMSGELHRTPAPAPQDGKKRKKGEPAAVAGQRAALPEEQQLQALYEELLVADQHLRPADVEGQIPVIEQWQIDGCYSDLARAAELLRLGLGDDTWNNLDAMHRAWSQSYASSAGPAREAKLQELMKEKKLSKREAEEELARTRWEAPYPDARTIEVPAAPAAPAVAPEAPAVAAPKAAADATRASLDAAKAAASDATPAAAPESDSEAVTEEPSEEPAMAEEPSEEPASEEPAEEPAVEAEPEPAAQPEPEVEKPAPAKPKPAAEPASDLPDL
ncbi:MAG TPA: hypothetical protein VEL07_23450 [Planctomycetota bacterium]|nr:hypothetical protein [Planctomycetota bacterium]